MTDDDITAMAALAMDAREPPWGIVADDLPPYDAIVVSPSGALICEGGAADLSFIAKSRTFVPAAIAEIRRLRAELSYLRSTGATNVE